MSFKRLHGVPYTHTDMAILWRLHEENISDIQVILQCMHRCAAFVREHTTRDPMDHIYAIVIARIPAFISAYYFHFALKSSMKLEIGPLTRIPKKVLLILWWLSIILCLCVVVYAQSKKHDFLFSIFHSVDVGLENRGCSPWSQLRRLDS